jgi:glycosyltransferase involved in cell wall biosynthesis
VISFCGDDILGSPKENGTLTKRSLIICRISKELARHCDTVIVKSEEMLKHIPRECKAYVVPNGVDFEMFKPIQKEEARKQLGLDLNKTYLLFPSNPNYPVKRFELAKRAFEIVRKTVTNCELLVIYGKRREEVSLYMNASDCLLLTSYHEGSPNIVKEAMACNLPIVSVKVGDVQEVISNTDGCYIVTNKPEDIAGMIIKVLNKGKRTDGRQNIAHLEISNIAKKIISIYQSL